MYTSNAYNIYKNNSINFASKEQLLVMIVDAASKDVKIARQAIIDKDIKKSHEYIMKTEDIYNELISSLDLSKAGEWGIKMKMVYEFIIRRLVQANIKKDAKILDEIIPLIENIKDTWEQAYKVSKGAK